MRTGCCGEIMFSERWRVLCRWQQRHSALYSLFFFFSKGCFGWSDCWESVAVWSRQTQTWLRVKLQVSKRTKNGPYWLTYPSKVLEARWLERREGSGHKKGDFVRLTLEGDGVREWDKNFLRQVRLQNVLLGFVYKFVNVIITGYRQPRGDARSNDSFQRLGETLRSCQDSAPKRTGARAHRKGAQIE